MILNLASSQVLLFTMPISIISPLPSNLMLRSFELFTSEDDDDIIILHMLVSLLGRPFYTVREDKRSPGTLHDYSEEGNSTIWDDEARKIY